MSWNVIFINIIDDKSLMSILSGEYVKKSGKEIQYLATFFSFFLYLIPRRSPQGLLLYYTQAIHRRNYILELTIVY